MKIKDGFYLREIVDTNVVVPAGERVIDFKGLMRLKGIAPFVWTILEKGATREEILARVLEEYDVTPEQAETDMDALLEEMTRLGLVEP